MDPRDRPVGSFDVRGQYLAKPDIHRPDPRFQDVALKRSLGISTPMTRSESIAYSLEQLSEDRRFEESLLDAKREHIPLREIAKIRGREYALNPELIKHLESREQIEELQSKVENTVGMADFYNQPIEEIWKNYDYFHSSFFGSGKTYHTGREILQNAWNAGNENVRIGELTHKKYSFGISPEEELELEKLRKGRMDPFDQMMSLPMKAFTLATQNIPLVLHSQEAGIRTMIDPRSWSDPRSGGMPVIASIAAGAMGLNAAPGIGQATYAGVLTAAFAVGQQTAASVKMADILAGLTMDELRTEAETYGVELDEDMAYALSLGSGALQSLMTMAQFQTFFNTIPGLKDYVSMHAQSNISSHLLKGAVTKKMFASLAESGSRGAKSPMAKGVKTFFSRYVKYNVTQNFQEMGQQTIEIAAQETYKALSAINEYSDEAARAMLTEEGNKNPTPEEIQEFKENNKAKRIPHRTIEQAAKEIFIAGMSASLSSLVTGLPGPMIQAFRTDINARADIRDGIRRTVYKAKVDNLTVAEITDMIKNDEGLKQYFTENQASEAATRVRQLNEIQAVSEVKYFQSVTPFTDMFRQAPDGTVYDWAGNTVESVPEGAYVRNYFYNDQGQLVDANGTIIRFDRPIDTTHAMYDMYSQKQQMQGAVTQEQITEIERNNVLADEIDKYSQRMDEFAKKKGTISYDDFATTAKETLSDEAFRVLQEYEFQPDRAEFVLRKDVPDQRVMSFDEWYQSIADGPPPAVLSSREAKAMYQKYMEDQARSGEAMLTEEQIAYHQSQFENIEQRTKYVIDNYEKAGEEVLIAFEREPYVPPPAAERGDRVIIGDTPVPEELRTTPLIPDVDDIANPYAREMWIKHKGDLDAILSDMDAEYQQALDVGDFRQHLEKEGYSTPELSFDEWRLQENIIVEPTLGEAFDEFKSLFGENYEGNPEAPDFTAWARDQGYTIASGDRFNFQIPDTYPLSRMGQELEYHKAQLERLGKVDDPFVKSAIDNLDQVIADNPNATYGDIIERLNTIYDELGSEIDGVKSAYRESTDSSAQKNLLDERARLEAERFKVQELKIVTKDILNKAFKYYNRVYSMIADEMQKIGALDVKMMEMNSPEYQRIITGQQTIGEIMDLIGDNPEAYLMENIPGLEEFDFTRISQEKIRDMIGRTFLDAEKVATDHLRKQQTLGRMEKGHKDRIFREISHLRDTVMRDVESTVHHSYAKAIESVQRLIKEKIPERDSPQLRNSAELRRHLINDLKNAREGIDSQYAQAAIDDLSSQLQTPIGSIPLNQLYDMAHNIEMLKTLGKHEQRMKQFERNMTSTITADAIKKHTGATDIEKIATHLGTKGQIEAMKKKGLRAWMNDKMKYSLTPERIFDMLDGFNELAGPSVNVFIDSRNRAKSNSLQYAFSRKSKVQNLINEMGLDMHQLHDTIRVGTAEMTVEQAMGVYLAMKNERTHNMIQKGNLIMAPEAFVDQLQALYPEAVRLADAISEDWRDVFNRLYDAHAEFTNERLQYVENYMPIISMLMEADDPYNEILSLEMRAGDIKEFGQGVEDHFTKRRTEAPDEGLARSMRLDLYSMWTEMVDKQEYYIAMAEPVAVMTKTLNTPGISDLIKHVYGDVTWESVDKYVKSQANPNFHKKYGGVDKTFRFIRHNGTLAYLAGNIGGVLKQIPSLAFYMPYAGPGNVMASLYDYSKNPKAFIERMKKIDPLYMFRMHELEMEMFKKMTGMPAQDAISKFGDKLMNLYRFMDAQVVAIGQDATMNQFIEAGYSPQEALDMTRKVTNMSQPSGDRSMQALIYKNSEAMNSLLMFSQQSMKVFNMMFHDMPVAWRNKNYHLFAAHAFAIAASGVGITALSKGRLSLEPEEIARDMFDYTVSTFPIVGRQIVSSTYEFYDNANIATKLPMSFVEVAKTLSNDNLSPEKKLVRVADLAYEGLALGTGIPYTGPRKAIRAIAHRDLREIITRMPDDE